MNPSTIFAIMALIGGLAIIGLLIRARALNPLAATGMLAGAALYGSLAFFLA